MRSILVGSDSAVSLSQQVQGTGGSSAVSKCSAAARGYIQDRFLRLLAGRRRRRRAPLIHRGYYIRARAVDHCVHDFLLKTQSLPRTQILSLGAGFDSLYFRLKDIGLLHHTVVYEVDFPNVACQKAALIKGMKELSALVGDTGGEGLGAITFSAVDYKLLGVDLSELSELERTLEEAGLNKEIPTLFIAEVVLTYMENTRSDALIQWAAEHFPQACFLMYEQVHPEDPFGHVMQQHFSQLNTALHSLAQYPDCEAQQRRFLGKGWTECSVMDMNEFFSCCIPEDEQQRVRTLEPFDEYEEWHLKCSHYFVLAASKGMEPSWTPLLPSVTGERLYHTVSCLSDTLALVVGGRTSPSSAGLGMLWLKFPKTCNAGPDDVGVELVSLQPAAEAAALRWRHSTTEITFKGEQYLFVYGGRSALEPVLGDWFFLHTPELSYTVIAVEGPVPESRHSHSACSWEGGVLIAGGLGAAEQPLGSVFLLRQLEHGLQWQTIETHPPLVPRYSHTAHVHEGKLLLVGGVWFHASCVPGVTVIDLMTGLCLNYVIDVEHLEWPLMLHNHSSVFLPNEKELLVIGGGGNCFSFGTHLNPEPVSLSLSSILISH
ncbi:tRNA wybutosine-synthesizing protein 4 isoform X2 [Cyanistes caeruleus]|uniref:tRNA wybutosine-synthesizing protein 4 isoform X2 n=1 Tax=Cyanistes caeruleus TaxID=156563 RepID=UPI000CDAFF2A|nr:tRNA wybutosine-synthesizing protein 4 isoform X2 [Cyanistes caeruleus]